MVKNQVHPGINLSAKSKETLNFMLHHVAEKIVRAANLSLDNNVTITSRHIQAGVRLIFPGELRTHAVGEGVKAVMKFNSNAGVKNRSARAKIQFSVPRAEHLIRQFSDNKARATWSNTGKHSKARVGATAPVYLATAVEYIAAEILELSGNAARDRKHRTINNRDIFLAIQNDQELRKLFHDINLNGVIPNIRGELLHPISKLMGHFN